MRTRPISVPLLVVLAACVSDVHTDPLLEVVTDTLGDTVVVRTVSGSAWGRDATLVPELSIGVLEGELEYLFGRIESLAVGADGTIYVVDGQVPELRAYEPDGRFRAVLAGPGEGPGELKNPDGGLAVLSDGRILVRDPGNARIQVLSPDGAPLDTWSIPGGFNSSDPLPVDRSDNVYLRTLRDHEADIADWVFVMAQLRPDGTAGDTLHLPDTGYEPPTLEARFEQGGSRSVSRTSVPFSPREHLVIHPDGHFVHAIATAYRIDLLRPGSPLRIERVYEPVPVTSGEKAEEEARERFGMRRTQPDWSWNGPRIPDRKPPFRDVDVGRDGRLWVAVSLPGYERDDPDYDPTDPESLENRWRERTAFDVFEPHGTYLGRVAAPDDFRRSPTPVFDGDLVWATTRDDLDVQRVVRYRIVLDGGS